MNKRLVTVFGAVVLAAALCQAAPTFAQYREQPSARQSRGGQFDLGGPVVYMREGYGDGAHVGVWIRRGFSNLYDATWIQPSTGAKVVDVVEVAGVEGGQLVIRRRGIKGTYTAPVGPGGRLGRGKASWVSDPKYFWEVVR